METYLPLLCIAGKDHVRTSQVHRRGAGREDGGNWNSGPQTFHTTTHFEGTLQVAPTPPTPHGFTVLLPV